jgi:ribose transport system substrate-binding protein
MDFNSTRFFMKGLQKLILLACAGILITACDSEQKADNTPAATKTIRIGFSQVTTAEPWRVLFNREMRQEAEKHAEVELVVADGQDRTEKQVADVETFIRQRMDVIMISPKESAGLTGAVEQATAAGIPVFVLDRGVGTEDYTQFVGANNLEIGRMAGQYVVDLLGGKGAANGKIVEIWGGMGSTPAQERHQGFAEFIDVEAGITRLVDRQDADWKQDRAYNIMSTALKAHPEIDLVYAHNDPMAFGAYLAAKDVGRETDIRFIGIDGIPDEGGNWVRSGFLTASFAYKTPGAEAIRQALKLLAGEEIPKRVELPTAVIDTASVDAYLSGNN